MVIPYVNANGKFEFNAPYDTEYDMDQEYTVTGVQSIKQLEDDGYDVLTYIYTNHGLLDTDYNDDLINNVPIIAMRSTGGTYIYIPSDRIAAIPDITGIKYQNKILAIDLGSVPLDLDLTTVSNIIVQNIQSFTGIVSTTEEVPNSAIMLFSQTENTQWLSATNARKTESKSNLTRYNEQLVINQELTDKITALENYIKTNLNP